MIDERFRLLFGKILYSGMHPVGQILDHNERREFQDRGAQHPHGILHVKDAPVFDKDPDDKVVEFIDKYISCAIPDERQYPELHKLVTTVQTHGHSQTCKRKRVLNADLIFQLHHLKLLVLFGYLLVTLMI